DDAMVAKMRNGGEACTAANRFYVQEGIMDAFATGLAERMAALKVGPGYEKGVQCGPLVNQDALERIGSWVDEAAGQGASILTGGKKLDVEGYYYPPTVLKNVPSSSPLVRDEIFGPIAPLASFKSEEEVIARANDTEYGLIAYVFTEDLARGLRVSEKLEAGMIGLNRGLASDPAAPFGGVKQSGLG